MKRSAVYAQALALPEPERLDLAAELLASARTAPTLLEEGTVELAKEIARRMDDVAEGRVKTIPAALAMKALRSRAVRSPRRK